MRSERSPEPTCTLRSLARARLTAPVGTRFQYFNRGSSTLAYLGEVVRAGIEGIPKGQVEAARSLGMGYGQTMRKVILPQALVNMTPSILNQLINLIKNTALGYIISVNELTFAANQVNNLVLTRPLQVFAILAIIYFLVCFTLTRGLLWVDFRVRKARAMV